MFEDSGAAFTDRADGRLSLRLSLRPERILVAGGTGFVGSHVVPLLRTAAALTPQGPTIRLLTHRRPAPGRGPGDLETVHGDLADPGTLHGVCEGVTTVLHLAARIGGSEADCRAVNHEGTRALLAEARRAGVRRFVQLGTAAVYGDGPHRGEPEGRLPETPVSATSVTRLAGERLVLAAGGTVLRPYLVYGEGDTWFVPALLRLLRRLPHWVDDGAARLSLISASSLAAVLTELALSPHPPVGRVLHAAHPEPVSARDLVSTVCRALNLPLPEGTLTREEALSHLDTADDLLYRRHLSLIALDRWYATDRLWSQLSTPPVRSFTTDFARYAPWYREALTESPV
ncbi:NAD-dependent epimerase/dehydratase family protein [Streptomyces sp. HUCO-GS316]|uniref:NAD-dependent epimerase/dehydratase family protein n=1 Tax=Streptomyces sp. HUCO-GS316 TaxID=2692198 RepID=UPI001371DACF|nr:NAD-dependent epimerase/dehydratase family protein [Streptomyces sp. HUCO-GS316]